jgi:hypothetical protein
MYIKNDSEYDNSRFINYNRWSNAKEVDALVTVLLANIKSRKKSGYKSVLKVLLLDLYQSYVADPEQYIGYVRDSTYYHFKVKVGDDRYVINPHIAYFCLVGAIDMLVEFGYVSSKTGQHFANEELGDNGFLSKMRATTKLALLWEEYSITTNMIHKYRQEEVIVQKDLPVEETVKDRKTGKDKKFKKKYEFNYKDTPETERMRAVVQRYNKQLDDTHIDCDAECISDADRKEVIDMLKEYKTNDPVVSVDLSSKNVHRVFNNRSFVQGGRFYGAWWIGCPSVLRKYITINGESTVELDYSGIHIHLLYAMKGINYAKRKEDAYALEDGVPDRDLNKLILLTALNAETVEGARDSVYDQLRKENRLKLYSFKRSKTPIMEKITLLKLKHAEIADCIASGEGVKLQYLDSCVIEKLIMYGMESDITLLTVHDSVICQAKYSVLVKDKMWQCYSDMLNTQLKCNIKYTKFTPHAGSVIKLLPVHNNQHMPPYSYIANDPLYQRYSPSPEMITNILKTDDIIKISNDSRTNTCAGTCRHGIRVSNHKNSKNNYLGTVKVKLKYSLGISS